MREGARSVRATERGGRCIRVTTQVVWYSPLSAAVELSELEESERDDGNFESNRTA